MKNTIFALLFLTVASVTNAQDAIPNFIEKDKTYVGAIAMTGEIVFKVIEVDKNSSWINVQADQPVFADKHIGWLNLNHLIALRKED